MPIATGAGTSCDPRPRYRSPIGDYPGPSERPATLRTTVPEVLDRPATRAALGVLLVALAARHAVQVADGGLQDFSAYYRGAWGAVHRLDPYDLRNPGGLLPFIYPPFAALVLGPLGLLPQEAAATAMTLVSLLALWVLASTTIGALWPTTSRGIRTWACAGVVVLALTTEPVWATLGLGQVNLVLAALVAVDMLRLRGTRWSGVLVGVAAGIKLTPAFFALFLLAAGRPRDAARAAATFVGTVAVAGVLMPRPSWRYVTDGDFLFSLSEVGKAANQSLLGAWTRLAADEDVVRWPWYLVAGLVAALGLWAAGRLDRAERTAEALVIAALTMLLVAPTSWTHYWVWVVPAAVVVAARTARRGPAAATLAATATLAPTLVGRRWFPPYPEVLVDHDDLASTFLDELYVLPGLVALLVVVAVSRRWRPDERSEQRSDDPPGGPAMLSA